MRIYDPVGYSVTLLMRTAGAYAQKTYSIDAMFEDIWLQYIGYNFRFPLGRKVVLKVPGMPPL